MDKISEKIKAARIAKGVTIEEIAEATLLSVNIIKRYRRRCFWTILFGDEALCKKCILRKIAKINLRK